MNLDHVGKYRVVERIGKGAMGEVYKAHDPLLNRYVALKTIAPALAADPDFRKRFEREAQSAAQLNHPNIITVFDFGDQDGLTYMAMELLEGRDLKDVIRGRGASLPQKLDVMEQMCEGLAFAHAKGIVHRDLKPGNVHVQPNGQVKILDFGLARLGTSEMTRTGTVMGTPHYMSPEQVRGAKADARSDVFSLGSVFYELLTEHRPFEAESMHGVLTHIVEQQPEPIRRWAPEVPQPIVEVVERALAKDAAARYADAGELGRALAAARASLAGESQAGETLVGGPANRTLSTILQAPEATLLAPAGASQPSLRGSIKGATALTLARSRTQHSMPGTVRPDPTVGPEPAEEPEQPEGGRTKLVLAAVALVVVAAATAGGVAWWRGRSAPLGSTDVAKEEVGILTDALVTSQVELARTDLANRDYSGAVKRANEALKLSPASREAQDVLAQAQQAQEQLRAAVEGTRSAFARGDVKAASDSLARVMALDPGHPVVAEMSRQLNQHFRGQAEQARTQTDTARAAATQARASSLGGFADGQRLLQEGDALFRRQEYAVAAQKFSEAKNAYERAAREADTARAAAAALRAASPQPSAAPSRAAVARPADDTGAECAHGGPQRDPAARAERAAADGGRRPFGLAHCHAARRCSGRDTGNRRARGRGAARHRRVPARPRQQGPGDVPRREARDLPAGGEGPSPGVQGVQLLGSGDQDRLGAGRRPGQGDGAGLAAGRHQRQAHQGRLPGVPPRAQRRRLAHPVAGQPVDRPVSSALEERWRRTARSVL